MTAIHASRTQSVNDNTEDSGAGPFIFYLSVLKKPPAISSKRKSSICKQCIEEKSDCLNFDSCFLKTFNVLFTIKQSYLNNSITFYVHF